MKADDAVTALNYLRQRYDYVLVDSETENTPWLSSLIGCSDEVAAVCTPDVACLRDLARHLEHLSLTEGFLAKLRVIAVTTPKRLSGVPEIPTVTEAGFPGIVSQIFAGLFAPKGTPAPIIRRVAETTHAALAREELQKLFVASGFEANLESGPENMRQHLADEITRWTPIIKASGLVTN